MDAERQPRRDLRQGRFGPLAAGEAVGENADMMAAVGLAVGDIDNVTEDSTHRGANRVKDAKRRVWRR